MSKNVVVVGMGKLGLPVATQFARSGFRVVGTDIDPSTVEAVLQGRAPFPGEERLDEYLSAVVTQGVMSASTDVSGAILDAQVVVIAVPVIIDSDMSPDFRALDLAAESVGAGLSTGTLVILETTVPIGTTRNRLASRLQEVSKMTAGEDFFVAYSPERVLTGRVFADLRRYPKIVGGINEQSTMRARAFYQQALQFDERSDLARPNGVWEVGSSEEAEFVKLAETTYRDVNIALANTFARYAETAKMDIHPIIEAANSQSYSHIHQPGIAVGGHCIPVYPHLYLSTDPQAELVREARKANKAMPFRAVEQVDRLLGGMAGSQVVILGASYRGAVKETAFSGVWDLVASIADFGGQALVHDPMYSHAELVDLGFRPYFPGDPCDAAILQADHPEYRSWSTSELPTVRVIYDGRGLLDPSLFPNVGFHRLGRGI